MDNDVLFPKYIHRDEERQVAELVEQVRADGKSQAALLYGPGGIGKTSLVREVALANARVDTIWLEPIDVDDSEYWLLSNLEQTVAQQLDSDRRFFGPYFDYLSRLPAYMRPDIGHETVVSHLGRIKRVFARCYSNFIARTGSTVVITFDTIETIRGMYLLLTLTQWMKALPGTLFILAGRPPVGGRDAIDPIVKELEVPTGRLELEDTTAGMPITALWLDEFSRLDSIEYLSSSGISDHISTDEKEKLALLARGHPLWLAFTVSYVDDRGLPEEANTERQEIERHVPFAGEMTEAGKRLHEDFKRRLMTPYREADFWHEGVNRLAIVRQSVDRGIWQRLMLEEPLPAEVESLEQTWPLLLQRPWIRSRANKHFVTLHDAVAEEIAAWIIPVHDQSGQRRLELWDRARGIYDELTAQPDEDLRAEFEAVDDRLKDLARRANESAGRQTTDEQAFVAEIADLDARKRRLDQLKAIGLFYQLLCDFERGCRRFLELSARAKAQHDVLFEDLLTLEMQRFLPGGSYAHALGDVIGQVIDRFRVWLETMRPELYVQIGLSVAEYLIEEEQPQPALELLDRLESLSGYTPEFEQRYREHISRGNCYMRLPGLVNEGLQPFMLALDEASRLTTDDRPLRVARAHKELGFYYRNGGMWDKADQAYMNARDALSPIMSLSSPAEVREEMASIQTNWGYVKGLTGQYRDGTNLVEAAVNVRRRLNKRQELGISLSTCGEVYRYERRFEKAWEAFNQAEQIFQELQNWAWLGLIYQEQAICLFQACQDGINLLDADRDPVARAKRLIVLALDICRDQAMRGYPSALNRAGRIFGSDNFDLGLKYLAEGVEVARALSDGWFIFSNLIEYVELSYRAWVDTGQPRYRAEIARFAGQIRQAIDDYKFPDLEGRWGLLQAHLIVRDWMDSRDDTQLPAALESYQSGFSLMANGYVGSSGTAAIPSEFALFRELFEELPDEVRAAWQTKLRDAWSIGEHRSTQLLARLEELY